MANILFKKGSYSNFKANVLDKTNAVTPGALYLTEDEGGLYIGTSTSSVKRIQGSVIFYDNILNFKEGVIDNPPYSRDVIYFIVDDNALIRWDESKNQWIQINATADSVVADINRLTQSINAEITRAKAAEAALTEQLGATNTEVAKKLDASVYNTFKTAYDQKITDLEAADSANAKAASDAAKAASNAQSTANGATTAASNAMAEAQKKADINHASTATTYGIGTGDKYGHVKLSDAVDSDSSTSAGIAATPKAAKTAYDKGVEALNKANSASTAAGNAQTTANQAVGAAADAQADATQALADAAAADAKGQKALDEKVDKTTYEAFLTANTAAIADAKAAGTTAQSSLNTFMGRVGDIPTGKTLKEYIDAQDNALQTAVNTEKSRAEGVEATLASGIQANAKAAADAQTQADKGVSDAAKAQTTANSAVTLAGQKLALSGGTMTGPIDMGSKKISNLATPTNNSDATTKLYVDNAIDDAIAKSDAMVYMGVISSSDALAAIKTANKGDTYKISKAFTHSSVNYKVGDLIINSNADGAAPKWDHISSGYEDDYLQKLTLDANNNIFITDGVANAVNNKHGGFRIVGDANSNLTFSVATDATTNIHVITATMEWGSF